MEHLHDWSTPYISAIYFFIAVEIKQFKIRNIKVYDKHSTSKQILTK